MAKRGRPPHDDILTPREWEVLSLIREGLSNDAIASRLGISLDGVKYHVSEILSKLGLENRHDAARWQPERDRQSWLLAPLLFWRRLDFGWLGNIVACAMLVLVVGAAGLLVWGLAETDGAPEKSQALASTPDVVQLQVTRGVTTPVTITTSDRKLIAGVQQALSALPAPSPCAPSPQSNICRLHHCPLIKFENRYFVRLGQSDGADMLTADLMPGSYPCFSATLTPGGTRVADVDEGIWNVIAQALDLPRCAVAPEVPPVKCPVLATH